MKSSLSILLAFLLLFSTVGVAKTTHWCMGHEMDSKIGFGEKHLDCGMEVPIEDSTSEDPSSCCENKTQHLQVDDDFQISQVEFQLNPYFILPFLQVFIFEAYFFNIQEVDFPAEYSPPIPNRDFQLLYQSFLI
uniref:HYC_CC_PP family protein n=1 Tax=Algoriphagus sp. TaxID=1872435 RepID=UPI0040478C8D